MEFVHEDNIKKKIADNYNGKKDELVAFYHDKYKVVREELLAIDFSINTDEIFKKATDIINKYFEEVEIIAKKCNIKSQSKFRSSFLEEISIYLFSDNSYIENKRLGFYNKKIYAGMKIGNNLNVNIMDKDVDFCIGKKVKIIIDNKEYEIILPVVAVEVKTYLDATMFGEVQYSSRLLKNSTPNVKTYVLMERNQVKDEKIIISRYERTLNEMFVLRGNKESLIDYKVLKDYYNQICDDIKNIADMPKVNSSGRLICVNE